MVLAAVTQPCCLLPSGVVNEDALRQHPEGDEPPDVPAANAHDVDVHLFPSPTTRDEVRASIDYGYQY